LQSGPLFDRSKVEIAGVCDRRGERGRGGIEFGDGLVFDGVEASNHQRKHSRHQRLVSLNDNRAAFPSVEEPPQPLGEQE
jgi:hypothetical protein